MKKKIKNKTSREENDEMKSHYDFSKMKFLGRGLYYQGDKKRDRLVPVNFKFWKAFPSVKAINRALELALSFQHFLHKNKIGI